MNENKNSLTEEEIAINELVKESGKETGDIDSDKSDSKENDSMPKYSRRGGVFRKFKIKDIVFLAVITAMMLLTGSVMPLLIHIPVFGIIQLGLGIQFSLFPVVGLMKVRKPGSLLLMSLFSGVLLVFMFPPMFFCLAVCALVSEILVFVIFRGYDKDRACVLAGTLYMPLTLPFLYVYYNFLYTWTNQENEAVSQFVGSDPLLAILLSVAVLALCFAGSVLGMFISRELRKAGVLKK